MSTLADTPQKVFHRKGRIYVSMASGLDFSFPIQGNPRLEGKPDQLLAEIEVSPFGLHWPVLAPVYELAWPFLRKLLSFRRLLAHMAMP
jgi:hypothetical protein